MEDPPGGSRSPHSTPRAAGRLLRCLFRWLAFGAWAFACATPDPLPEPPAAGTREPGSLRVRLVFGGEADLDLYVTDPKLETVYFGNNPSLGGGHLSKDQRCDDPAPRVESVTFAQPLAGRYRVGVEFAKRCTRARGAVPFSLEVETDGWRRQVQGEIEPSAFLPAVMEFELKGEP
jgi:hypothetical protein